jgi:hypothetical protein
MATRNAQSLGKPKPKTGDDQFRFQMPSKEQMDEQKSGGRGRIPAARYIGKCVGVVAETSKKSSNPMWTFDFVITKGEYAGRDFKLWAVLTDAAAWKVQETMEALGVECPPGEEIVLNKKEVIGVGVEMKIVDDNGKDGDGEFSKLDKIFPHPQGAGFRPAAGLSSKNKTDDDEGEDTGRDEQGEDDQGEEEERPARRSSRQRDEEDEDERPTGKRGKAPVRLGNKRR